jgi:Rps23 Pro-64 3,4-dihydroxylase Tpa1-like proline 4-hydroxylase
MDKINIADIDILITDFKNNQKINIFNFLEEKFAEELYKNAIFQQNWILSTGINNTKFEKPFTKQFEKINLLQIKNINNAFSRDDFSYSFYRSMNNIKISYLEFTLRKILNSKEFINLLNKITDLNLTELTTLFMSKYTSGNFLSPHSDKGNGKLAFVIGLTKYWKPQYGGNLHFLNDNRTEITHTFSPNFNNFIIFKIPEQGIPHYVSHVAPNVKYPRISITGWFN